ncbi:hypothetical protein CsSME_00036182 [Camellia sinensis var. sinensis]
MNFQLALMHHCKEPNWVYDVQVPWVIPIQRLEQMHHQAILQTGQLTFQM